MYTYRNKYTESSGGIHTTRLTGERDFCLPLWRGMEGPSMHHHTTKYEDTGVTNAHDKPLKTRKVVVCR